MGLTEAVREASARPEVGQAIAAIYEELGRRIEARRLICQASGRCCRFEEYGHRLYVTTLELAAFIGKKPEEKKPHALPVVGEGGACPFQIGGLCSVHTIRPFGCRVFFCDPTSTQWQQDQYEQLHATLKKLHVELNVPYFYIEWRQALEELGLSTGRMRL